MESSRNDRSEKHAHTAYGREARLTHRVGRARASGDVMPPNSLIVESPLGKLATIRTKMRDD
jgi:hypothetical protein